MKKEQQAFAQRLVDALAVAGIEASPTELEKLLARHGGTPVTPQAISGWLTGKHLPKQANMRALAKMVGLEPYALQYGEGSTRGVRERMWRGPTTCVVTTVLPSRNSCCFRNASASWCAS
jgi:hypothetical protein